MHDILSPTVEMGEHGTNLKVLVINCDVDGNNSEVRLIP